MSITAPGLQLSIETCVVYTYWDIKMFISKYYDNMNDFDVFFFVFFGGLSFCENFVLFCFVIVFLFSFIIFVWLVI